MAEAYILLVPGCPRGAGGVTQIQSTPFCSPNCLFALALRTITPPKTSLCSPSTASLTTLATKGTASVNSPVILQTQATPWGNDCWEESSTACTGDGVLQHLRLRPGTPKEGLREKSACMGFLIPEEKLSRMHTQHKEMVPHPLCALPAAHPCPAASPGGQR